MNFSKKIFSLFLFMVFGIMAFCQNFPKPSNPPRLVNDYTGTLTADQAHDIENKLVAFDDSTSTQVAVVIISSLDGDDISDYGVKLGRAWGIGGKEFSNGILLLISKGDRKINISTGYGVEGALPDITAKHIIDDVIKPNFRGEDYYRGIDEGTDAIIKAVKGEYNTPRARKSIGKGGGRLIFIIVIIIVVLILRSGGRGGGGMISRRGSFWGPFILGNMLGSGGRGGGGSSWGGGSSGGGFGGFGGGSFGGGGASGSW